MRAFILALSLFFLCGCEIEYRVPRKHTDASEAGDVTFSPASFKDKDKAAACTCDPPCSSGYRCFSGECKPIAARARARARVASEV